MGKESWRRTHRGIVEGESWGRNHRVLEGMEQEESTKRQILEDRTRKRILERGILEREASKSSPAAGVGKRIWIESLGKGILFRRHLGGGPQEAPRRLGRHPPGDTQEAPRRLGRHPPGDTQEAGRGTQEEAGRHPGNTQEAHGCNHEAPRGAPGGPRCTREHPGHQRGLGNEMCPNHSVLLSKVTRATTSHRWERPDPHQVRSVRTKVEWSAPQWIKKGKPWPSIRTSRTTTAKNCLGNHIANEYCSATQRWGTDQPRCLHQSCALKVTPVLVRMCRRTQ